MKNITLLSLAVFIIALLPVSCQKEKPYQDGDRTVVPFSLRTVITRVSYTGETYAFKAGDKLAISSSVRPDITGELSYDGSSTWTGSVSYLSSEGEPAASTALKVTLVHADNTDQATYANGIASSLQTAVEKYSLFTDAITFESTTATLEQQACFLTATVTFSFENGNFHLAGETSVDVIVNNSLTVSGRADLARVGETNSYSATFVIAMPGSTTLTDESVIQICDRDVQMVKTNMTLAANNKYTVSREINFVPQLGDPFWSDGTYGRISHDPGVEITGIIVFVNNYEDSDDSDLAKEARALTEKSAGFGRGLVMSLKNAGVGIEWGTNTSKRYTTAITTPNQILGISNVSGYSNTNTQRANAANTAANLAYNYRSTSGDTMTGTSGWFLPSIGQWVYSISNRGFGGADPAEQWKNNSGVTWLNPEEGKTTSLNDLVRVLDNQGVNQQLLVKSLNDRMQVLRNQFGCDYDSFGFQGVNGYGDNYWSSSEYNSSQAIRMNFGSVEKNGSKYYSTIKVKNESKTSTWTWYEEFLMKVRPFLAF